MKTVCEQLQAAGFAIAEILIPESCALVYAADGTEFHVTALDDERYILDRLTVE